MNSIPPYLISFLKKIGLAFAVFTVCRFIFYIANLTFFEDTFSLGAFIFGIRFDFVAISYLFVPFILLSVFPFGNKHNNSFKKINRVLFDLSNTIGIVANLLDSGYFRFSQKRSTADIFQFLNTGNDFLNMLPSYITDFWYLFAIAVVLIVLSDWLYKKIDLSLSENDNPSFGLGIKSIIFLIVTSFTVIGFRGGVQLKPLDIINAATYTKATHVPLVLNTPFSIIKTILNEQLIETDYFKQNELTKIYTPELNINPTTANKKNVVLVILESFAKEYVGYYKLSKGYTPFLDSLMQHSYVFTNAYSSGTRSIESLPSIFAGIPSLMITPYVISNFSGNKIDALPAILEKNGYNTSFYHGGENGTMGFNSFCATAGVSQYFGKNEYPKDKDDDGAWGIPDGPYLQYFAKELNKKNTPFFSTVFTLSSHHPYLIPENMINRFDGGELPIHKTIQYTDFALSQFFEKAKQANWFSNTIFVFVSDHSSEMLTPFYTTVFGRNAIPVFIYDASKSIKGTDSNYFQQIDITPSILHLLGIKTPLFSFGNNAFSDAEKYIIGFSGTSFYLAKDNYLLFFNGNTTTGFYDLSKDSTLTNDLSKLPSNNNKITEMENHLKAIVQQYYHRLKANKTSLANK